MKEVPSRLFGPKGAVLVGTYRGGLSAVSLAPSGSGKKASLLQRVSRTMREKRWQYACAATPEVLVACAVVDAGFAGNAFVSVVDLTAGGGTVREHSFLGAPRLNLEVNDRPGEGALARFEKPGVRVELWRPRRSAEFRLEIQAEGVDVDLKLDGSRAPSPFCVIARPAIGRVAYTQKTNLIPAQGHVRCGSRSWDLNGGFGGLDFTLGQLPRVTEWRWGFGLGRLGDGTPIGFNLAAGNHLGGQNENILWMGEELFELAPMAFDFQSRDLMDDWRLCAPDGSVDLRFRGRGLHREDRNLLVVQSHFAQVSGLYDGFLRLPSGRGIEIQGIPGVVEDQRVKW